MTPDELAALTHRPGPGEHRATIDLDGIATTTLVGDGRVGTAVLTATLGGGAAEAATLDVPIH